MQIMQAENSLFVVIPTLDAAHPLRSNTTAREAERLVISDGGSADTTLNVAAELEAIVVEGARGRGQQLAAGASTAIKLGATWLLFLHADTNLSEGWQAEVENFVVTPENQYQAGVFKFALDETSAEASRLTRRVNWRSRTLALPYGDQGLLISADFYRQLGGYRDLALMEDVDIVRRIGRQRLHMLDTEAVTHASRFVDGGYTLRSLRNLFCLALFFARVPVNLIAKIYG